MEEMNPYGIEMEDISNVFFSTMSGASNTRYFNAQELAREHRGEERVLNCALYCKQVELVDWTKTMETPHYTTSKGSG